MIVVLNQMDQAERRGITIDIAKLEEFLKVKIIATNAKSNEGIDELKKEILHKNFKIANEISFDIPFEQKAIIDRLLQNSDKNNQYKIWTMLSSDTNLGKVSSLHDQLNENDVKCIVPKRLQTQETIRRYQNIDKIVTETV